MKGMSVQRAPAGNEWLPTVGNNLTATGNSQGTALAIPLGQDLSIVTTAAGSTGVVLPGVGVGVGEEYVVCNHGANTLSVYPAGTGKMGTGGSGAAYSLNAGKAGYFIFIGLGNWSVNP